MRKTLLFGLIGIMAVSAADAGWFSNLFTKKASEPATLEDACNTDEITSICPETILGEKTLLECLMDNVSGLSTKCATFVKKQVTEKVASVSQQVADGKDTATANAAEQVATTKAAAENLKTSLKATKDAAVQIVKPTTTK